VLVGFGRAVAHYLRLTRDESIRRRSRPCSGSWPEYLTVQPENLRGRKTGVTTASLSSSHASRQRGRLRGLGEERVETWRGDRRCAPDPRTPRARLTGSRSGVWTRIRRIRTDRSSIVRACEITISTCGMKLYDREDRAARHRRRPSRRPGARDDVPPPSGPSVVSSRSGLASGQIHRFGLGVRDGFRGKGLVPRSEGAGSRCTSRRDQHHALRAPGHDAGRSGVWTMANPSRAR